MACPYFYPVERLDEGRWIKPPRLPLGGPYRGVCRALDDAFQPDENALRESCNAGYARGRCSRFPSEAAADALRYSIEADSDNVIEIVFIREKEWSPAGHGRARWTAGMMTCDEALDPLVERQMEMFIRNYLARKNDSASP